MVVVVGAGIAGLVAAWALSAEGAPPVRVVVVEADDRVGGKLALGEIDGLPIDVGPDGFLGRRPEAVDLCHEVGLGPSLRPVSAGGAAVWARGRLRAFPPGGVLGVPTRLVPTVRSGILGPLGSLRLAVDLVAPRRDLRGPLGDRAIGPLVQRKLGSRVVHELVEPLVGGIHAGRVADMSAAAVFPALLAAADERGSLMRALRRVSAPDTPPDAEEAGEATDVERDDETEEASAEATPLFWTLREGVGELARRLRTELVARGVEVRTGIAVDRLARGPADGPTWAVRGGGTTIGADAVVLALPAGPAAGLLEPHDAEVAALLRGIDYASVGLVTLVYPSAAVSAPLEGTGFLVPAATRLRATAASELGAEDRRPWVTACTYLSNKWRHLEAADRILVRASVGRFGDQRALDEPDDALIARVVAELEHLGGLPDAPTAALVTRWPDSFPQYRVHHLLRVAGIEAAARRLPAIALAGAAYRGVGIPACIASGRSAAEEVGAALAGRRSPRGTPP